MDRNAVLEQAVLSTSYHRGRQGGKIFFWNPGAERIFGHRSADALGQSLDIIIPERLPRASLVDCVSHLSSSVLLPKESFPPPLSTLMNCSRVWTCSYNMESVRPSVSTSNSRQARQTVLLIRRNSPSRFLTLWSMHGMPSPRAARLKSLPTAAA